MTKSTPSASTAVVSAVISAMRTQLRSRIGSRSPGVSATVPSETSSPTTKYASPDATTSKKPNSAPEVDVAEHAVVASVIASPGVKPMRASMNTDSEKNTAMSPSGARRDRQPRQQAQQRQDDDRDRHQRQRSPPAPGRPDRMNSASPITTGPITRRDGQHPRAGSSPAMKRPAHRPAQRRPPQESAQLPVYCTGDRATTGRR